MWELGTTPWSSALHCVKTTDLGYCGGTTPLTTGVMQLSHACRVLIVKELTAIDFIRRGGEGRETALKGMLHDTVETRFAARAISKVNWKLRIGIYIHWYLHIHKLTHLCNREKKEGKNPEQLRKIMIGILEQNYL